MPYFMCTVYTYLCTHSYVLKYYSCTYCSTPFYIYTVQLYHVILNLYRYHLCISGLPTLSIFSDFHLPYLYQI